MVCGVAPNPAKYVAIDFFELPQKLKSKFL